jgi:hypothetical protein
VSFNIIYVENRDSDWEPIWEAVEAHNAKSKGEYLNIERARTPEELSAKLDDSYFDAVLADVYYDDLRAEITQDIDDRLDDVIDFVEKWRVRQPLDRSLPIIAYTGVGAEALKSCLRRRHKLYDIWDKNTALPDYIAWRLSRLAIDVSRGRPDARMQQLILDMDKNRGATWHRDVIDMVRRYDSGWTERDQIERAGEAIGNIAHEIKIYDECWPMWEIVKNWEWIGRAVSPHVRGHARHVINVFWLGYYLLHAKPLAAVFRNLWSGVVARRKHMEAVASANPLDSLSNMWFLAGLFHDVAGSVEKAQAVTEAQVEIVRSFWRDPIELPNRWPELVREFSDDLCALIDEFEPPLRETMKSTLERGLESGSVDHGLLAGMHVVRLIKNQREACFAREASRAMALHNMFPDFSAEVASRVTWESEPIACLLLLCDQIQTWDRERSDQALKDDDRPQRAELASLDFQKKDGHIIVQIRINYIAPVHVLRSPEIYGRVQDELERILKQRPDRALKKIGGYWPFRVRIESSLSGRMLRTPMILGYD